MIRKAEKFIVKEYLPMPVNTIYKRMHKTEKSKNKKVKIFCEKVGVNCTVYPDLNLLFSGLSLKH